MTETILEYINQQLDSIGVNYEFGEWRSKIVYPYFVGEYAESAPVTEDGLHESSFLLTGFTRGQHLELERAKAKIEKLFTYNSTILKDGSGVDISYAGSTPIPTGDAELKRIQINLSIKEWRAI